VGLPGCCREIGFGLRQTARCRTTPVLAPHSLAPSRRQITIGPRGGIKGSKPGGFPTAPSPASLYSVGSGPGGGSGRASADGPGGSSSGAGLLAGRAASYAAPAAAPQYASPLMSAPTLPASLYPPVWGHPAAAGATGGSGGTAAAAPSAPPLTVAHLSLSEARSELLGSGASGSGSAAGSGSGSGAGGAPPGKSV
jgi:hypothetical protein